MIGYGISDLANRWRFRAFSWCHEWHLHRDGSGFAHDVDELVVGKECEDAGDVAEEGDQLF